MTLRDERNEQNLQKWHDRLERERLNLSASVEATLIDISTREESRIDASDDLDDFLHASRDTTLIPPRISLQSRIMPAMSAVDGSVESVASSDVAPTLDARTDQRSVSTTAHANVLVRLAHRLSSLLPAITQSEVVVSEEQKRVAIPHVIDAFPPVQAPLPGISQVAQSRLRVAGDTGKIRRQTLAMPKVTLKPVEAENTISAPNDMQETKISDNDVVREETRSTSMHLPAVEMLHGTIGHAGRGALSGTDIFEIGQREVTVRNTNVTASSIVLVTLTTDPGRVVVQYVSLQPGTGFTVHLSAPAGLKTAFNYIVLLGELF